MFKIKINNNFSVSALVKILNPAVDNASAVAVNETIARADKFTPYLNGDLQNSLELIKKGRRYTGIVYNVEYAERIYTGLESWDWTINTHPNARPRWIHHAYDLFKADIVKKVSTAVTHAL